MKPNVSKELKLSHPYLLQILEYFPDKGIFIWKENNRNQKDLGKEAGSKNNGRYRIQINKITYLRSRLAWFYTHGFWPKNQLDHKNRVRHDDRIENLREATSQQNSWNRVLPRKDDLPKGIYIRGNKFKVEIRHEEKLKYLGTFANLDDAIKAREEFEHIHRKFLYD
tara:strand:- start:376 stop:876 length:501 start_codon:yes stop_codon:yes gene_type:complete